MIADAAELHGGPIAMSGSPRAADEAERLERR